MCRFLLHIIPGVHFDTLFNERRLAAGVITCARALKPLLAPILPPEI